MANKNKGGSAAKPNTPALNMGLLSTIAAATKANSFVYCTDADNAPLLSYPGGPLVEVAGPYNAESKIATRATSAGIALVDGAGQPATSGSPFGGDASGAPASGSTVAATKPTFAIITVALGDKPKRTRPEGIGESKYPFAQLPAPTPEQIAAKTFPSFFVPASDDLPEPWKSLSSTVNGAQKRLFGTKIGTKTIERAKRGAGRGAPALIDPATGQKIKETVTVDEYSYSGEFTIYRIEDGTAYGAPGVKGAAIARVR